MKTCSRCKQCKHDELFVSEHWKKMRRKELCIACYDELKLAKYARKNEKMKRQYREDAEFRRKAIERALVAEKKESRKEYRKRYRQQNAEKISDYQRSYREQHKEEKARNDKLWRENNKERTSKTKREWRKKNPEKAAAKSKRDRAKRRESDVNVFSDRIRLSIWHACQNNGISKVKGKTFSLLGYTKEALREHLSAFMGKACIVCNDTPIVRGSYHIDHIVPVCTATTIEDVIVLNRLENLRLICASCNLRKIADDKRQSKRIKRR